MFIALSVAAFAQAGSPVDGVVVDRGGVGVSGATVTFFTRQSVRYQATSDSSGAFHIGEVESGAYEAMVEKTGFVVFSKDRVEVGEGGAPVRVHYEMPFGTTRPATLRGRVMNSQGQPAANAQVDLITSAELWHGTMTDADGRFSFDRLSPGVYKLRAAPANGSRSDVATYFPASMDEAGAERIVVRGNALVDGLWLQTAPVFHVRGVVRDNNGPAARVNVKLTPITQQAAHVISSFGPYFLTASEGRGPGPDVAYAVTAADGSFDFSPVPAGEWRVVAQTAEASGAQSVTVQERDVTSVQVNVAPPFELTGSAGWAVAQCHDPGPPDKGVTPGTQTTVIMCGVDGRRAPGGTAYPIWFDAMDGQSSILTAAVIQGDGTFSLQPVHAGLYAIKTLPALANPAVTNGHVLDYSLPAIRNREVAKGATAEVGRNFGALELSGGGVFNPDGTKPVQPALLTGPGEVRGTIEEGAGAAVVLVWAEHSEDALGQFVLCQTDGSFEAKRLAPGSYYAAAFRGLDIEGLRAPELLQHVIATGIKVEVKADSSTELRLQAEVWGR